MYLEDLMGFDKKYPNSKDARRRLHRYRDSRDFDKSCRCHGGCGWCLSNRMHRTRKREEAAGKPVDDREER